MAGDFINNGSVPKGAAMYEETKNDIPKLNNCDTATGSSFEIEDDDGLEMVPVGVMGTWGSKTVEIKYDDDNVDDERPTNERLLCTAFFTFMTFTTCQSVAAYIAGSEAMMGDSAAMLIDALTYLFNLIAERRKSRFEEFYQEKEKVEDPIRRRKIKLRAKRKMTLQLEIVPPIVSVTTLIIVTIIVLKQSITILQLDTHRDPSEQADPNVNLMLVFSCANLLLDLFNVCCFAHAKRLFGYETEPRRKVPEGMTEPSSLTNYAQVSGISDDSNDSGQNTVLTSQERLRITNGDFKKEGFEFDEHEREFETIKRESEEIFEDEITRASTKQAVATKKPKFDEDAYCLDGGDDDESQDIIEEANLNMCSAYTVSDQIILMSLSYTYCSNQISFLSS